MTTWLHRHRHGIYTTYVVITITIILALQILEAQGVIR